MVEGVPCDHIYFLLPFYSWFGEFANSRTELARSRFWKAKAKKILRNHEIKISYTSSCSKSLNLEPWIQRRYSQNPHFDTPIHPSPTTQANRHERWRFLRWLILPKEKVETARWNFHSWTFPYFPGQICFLYSFLAEELAFNQQVESLGEFANHIAFDIISDRSWRRWYYLYQKPRTFIAKIIQTTMYDTASNQKLIVQSKFEHATS